MRILWGAELKERDKRVLFVTEEGEGIARPLYRGKVPSKGLESFGWKARTCPVLYEQEDHTWNGYTPGETIRGLTPRFIVSHVLLSPRPGTKPNEPLDLQWEPQKEIIESARNAGQKWFFDLDDNVWELPPWNPAYGKPYGISSHLQQWVTDFNSADGLIVSTSSIAESAKAGGVTVPIHIARNCVLTNNIRPHISHDPLRIGYVGLLDFRKKDFEVIIEEMREVFRGLREELEFWHLGAHFDPEKPQIRDLLRPFPLDIVERPWCSPYKFQDALRELDLAVLPAFDHPFNDGRSYVVGLELMAAGVPFWSSPTKEYRELNKTMECCDFKFKDWFWHNAMIQAWREDWSRNAQEEVLNHGPKNYASVLIEIFESCMTR